MFTIAIENPRVHVSRPFELADRGEQTVISPRKHITHNIAPY